MNYLGTRRREKTFKTLYISLNIPFTVLRVVVEVLTRRILSSNQELLLLVIISFIRVAFTCDSGGDIAGENLDASPSLESKR